MVPFDDFGTVAVLLLQFEGRLEEIDKEARQSVQLREFVRSFQTLIPAITHHFPNDRAVLLLNKGLIIFPIEAAACESYPIAKAIVSDGLIHKDAVIVGGEPQKRKRQQFSKLG
jgi:hypothetical protein